MELEWSCILRIDFVELYKGFADGNNWDSPPPPLCLQEKAYTFLYTKEEIELNTVLNSVLVFCCCCSKLLQT